MRDPLSFGIGHFYILKIYQGAPVLSLSLCNEIGQPEAQGGRMSV